VHPADPWYLAELLDDLGRDRDPFLRLAFGRDGLHPLDDVIGHVDTRNLLAQVARCLRRSAG